MIEDNVSKISLTNGLNQRKLETEENLMANASENELEIKEETEENAGWKKIEIEEIEDPSKQIPYFEYENIDLTYSVNEKYARANLEEELGVAPTDERNVFPLSTCYSCKLGKKPPTLPKYLAWDTVKELFNR